MLIFGLCFVLLGQLCHNILINIVAVRLILLQCPKLGNKERFVQIHIVSNEFFSISYLLKCPIFDHTNMLVLPNHTDLVLHPIAILQKELAENIYLLLACVMVEICFYFNFSGHTQTIDFINCFTFIFEKKVGGISTKICCLQL